MKMDVQSYAEQTGSHSDGLITRFVLRMGSPSSKLVYSVYFFLIAVLTCRAVMSSMTEIPSYHLTDWGINYAGGFVRRGLIGEGLLRVSEATGWSFVWLATSVAIVATLGFVYFAARLFYPLRDNHWAWLLIYAPFGFVAPVLNSNIAGHKDHILLFLGAALFYVAATWKAGKAREWMIYALLLLTVPLLLVHEGYVIFLPLLFLALTVLPLSPRVFAVGIVIGILDVLVLLVSVKYVGEISHRNDMMAAFYAQLPLEWAMRPLDEYVAFFYIGQDFHEAMQFTHERVVEGVRQLPAALTMTLGPLGFFTWKLGPRRIFDNWSWSGSIAAFLIVTSIVAQLAILPVIIDWTRFFNIFLVLASMALAMRLWTTAPDWRHLPGCPNRQNVIMRYTFGWAVFASMILLKPGKVLPEVIKFEADDVLAVLLISAAIFIGCKKAAKAQIARSQEGKDEV